MRRIVGLIAAAGLAAPLAVASAGAGVGAANPAAPPVRLAGSAAAFTASLPSTGPVPGTQRLAIQVWLAPRDPAGAARYAMAVSTPGNPLFHNFLRPDAYTGRFGGTTAEASGISAWLRRAGFTDVAAGEQRSYVQATASVSVIDAALGIRLRYYRATSQVSAGPYRLRGNDRAVRVPAAVAPSVLAVTGLDNEAPTLPPARRAAAGRAAARPKFPCSHYYGQHRVSHLPRKFGVTSFPTSICGYSASQLRRAYGANQASNGHGQTVALVELGLTPDMFLTLRDYARLEHMPAPSRPRYAELDLGRRSCPDVFNVEEPLDVEAAYDMAPRARELVVSASSCNSDYFQDLCDALLRILGGTGDRPLATIASNSWENPLPPTTAQQRLSHSVLMRAAAEGVGMYFSTNDGPGVRSPAEDPFATAVGGITLGIGRSGHPLFETGWSTGQAFISRHRWTRPQVTVGAGGGPSARWAEPAYQKGVVPTALSKHGTSRSLPDLSAVADFDTGMTIVVPVIGKSGTRFATLTNGGTSLATPLVAGLVADAQQGHAPFGFLNPVLYRLAGTRAFHDVLPVTRRTPARYRAMVCASRSSCDFGSTSPVLNVFDVQPGPTGQVTLRGYDNMTGLGTPNGQAFIAALRRMEH